MVPHIPSVVHSLSHYNFHLLFIDFSTASRRGSLASFLRLHLDSLLLLSSRQLEGWARTWVCFVALLL